MAAAAFSASELEAIGDGSVAARDQGHTLGTFRRIDGRLTAALCGRCGAAGLVLVARGGCLVTAGSALSYPCSPGTADATGEKDGGERTR